MREYRADLHIHTCLSPCASDEMVPGVIVAYAKRAGVGLLGICDHNSAENVAAMRAAGERAGIGVIGGMEITSAEEVHVVVLLDDAALGRMQQVVYDSLAGENDEEYFGRQVTVGTDGMPAVSCAKLLIGATTLALEQIVRIAHEMGGVVIASHVDRDAFGIIGQLGFIPEGLQLDAIEVSPRCAPAAVGSFARHGLPIITASDAHQPADIGARITRVALNGLSVHEVKMALAGRDGRWARID